MTAKQIIEVGLAYSGMSKTALAEKLGWSPQLLHKRITTGKFSVDEWETIAREMGGELKLEIVFPNGNHT